MGAELRYAFDGELSGSPIFFLLIRREKVVIMASKELTHGGGVSDGNLFESRESGLSDGC